MKYRRYVTLTAALFSIFFACWQSDYSRISDTFAKLKGKEEVTVVVVGDTITGAGASYAKMLKPKFADLLGARISLINSSRPDQTFDQAKRFYQEDVLSFRPDVVLIMLGTVDASSRGMYLATFEEAVSNFFGLLRKEDTLVIVLTPPGYQERWQAVEMQDRLTEFCDIIIRQARLHHFPLIDIANRMEDLWSKSPEEYRKLFSDAVHLNGKGNEFIAESIMSTIRRTMEQAVDH